MSITCCAPVSSTYYGDVPKLTKKERAAWNKQRKQQEAQWRAEYEVEQKILASARAKLTEEEYDAVLKKGHYTENL